MPNPKQHESVIKFTVPTEAKAALEALAETEGIPSVSELIRQLLSNYCQHNGYNVDFHVGQWGGKRESQQLNESEVEIANVQLVADRLQVTLTDDRQIAHPIAWYSWLAQAAPEQAAHFIVTPGAIYWPELEDGISIDVLLRGPRRKHDLRQTDVA